MILKAFDETVYKVHFRHFLPVHINGKRMGRATWPEKVGGLVYRELVVKRPMTECFIHHGACHRNESGYCFSSTYFGQAVCNPKDTFDKRQGRYIALRRALKAINAGEGLTFQLVADYARQLMPRDCQAVVPPFWNTLLQCTSETCHRPLPCPVHGNK